jgi:hypothetical protein
VLVTLPGELDDNDLMNQAMKKKRAQGLREPKKS